ncbi:MULTISPECIES: MDR family MFS transporter [Enterococcaceae]|uniref:MDR family MFS transporter n=1 Tax=Enterococcaceae TaxID=81852 RepID=UPI000E4E21FD|nr:MULTISPECIES: MDR family MFS transporter [Enterococcaceae]MCI0130189.1 multidrug efflux MFS transporter [Vagococcus sp. CY53-2]RGI31049.1 MFS transporter [Melissococcus sp. OM08-11BH]
MEQPIVKLKHRNILVITIIIGSFCTVLNQMLLTTAYPDLMRQFSVSTSTIQWLTTGFLLVNGIMIPVSAYFMNNVPTKKLYIGAITLFLIGTIICFVSTSFNLLLFGRIIQAMGVGISLPLLQTIMLSIYPENERGKALGIAGIVIGLAPAIGPTLSGWVIDTFNWRYLFGLLIPIILFVIVLSIIFMQNVLPLHPSKIDIPSPILSTLGFGSLLYGFSLVGDHGWTDPLVLLLLILGTALVVIFCKRQLKISNPFLRMEVFKSKLFINTTILSGIVNMAMVGAEMVLPLYIQNVRGYNPFHSGLVLFPGALILGIMMPITGKLFDKYGEKYLSIIGMSLLTIGTACLCTLNEKTPMHFITIIYGVRMLGVSMVMMPITTAGMNSLPDTLISHGSAANNTAKQLFSSIGTAILISFLSQATLKDMPHKSLLLSSPITYKSDVLSATLHGYNIAFIVATLFCAMGLAQAIFMGMNKSLNK